VLADLRARIARIERHPVRLPPSDQGGPAAAGLSRPLPSRPSPPGRGREEHGKGDGCREQQAELESQAEREGARWSLGAPGLDGLLPGGGLDPAGLHEIKPAAHAGRPAAIAFALALAARRGRADMRPLLWVAPAFETRESGRPYGPGLTALGLDPARLLLIETASARDALWAIEEGLKAQALALVVGVAGALGPTPGRRLSLAAGQGATPCLLVTPAGSPGIGAARTRWRVTGLESAPAPASAPDALSRRPGPLRVMAALERCRHGPPLPRDGLPFALEWSHEAYRFRLSPPLADRAAHGKRAEPGPPERSGRSAGRRAG
jgi:protein ImuA